MRPRFQLLAGFGLAAMLASCGDDGTGPSTGQLRIYPATDTLAYGMQAQFSASVDGNLVPVTWKVIPTDAGDVSEEGLFTAGRVAGKTMVIARRSMRSVGADTMEIEVIPAPAIKRLVLTRDTILIGHTSMLVAEFEGGTGTLSNGQTIASGDSVILGQYYGSGDSFHTLQVMGYRGKFVKDSVRLTILPIPRFELLAESFRTPIGGSVNLQLNLDGYGGTVRLIGFSGPVYESTSFFSVPISSATLRTFGVEISLADTVFTREVTVTGVAPAAGQFGTPIPLPRPRDNSATALLADGTVLVAGGVTSGGAPITDAIIIDPSTRAVRSVGSLHSALTGLAAVRLADGRVLVAGTQGSELFDPMTDSFTVIGSSALTRNARTLNLLPNGKVLVFGGNGVRKAELFDPQSLTYTLTDSTSQLFYTPRTVSLADGRVLVSVGSGTSSTATEIYDHVTGRFSRTGSTLMRHEGMPMVRMQDGRILVAGAWWEGRPDGVMEIYDPATATWSGTGAMATPRAGHSATLLRDGRVLISGGYGNAAYQAVRYDEIFDPAAGISTPILSGLRRVVPTAVSLTDGRVLFTGANGAIDAAPIFEH